jgi:hypothetical protein
VFCTLAHAPLEAFHDAGKLPHSTCPAVPKRFPPKTTKSNKLRKLLEESLGRHAARQKATKNSDKPEVHHLSSSMKKMDHDNKDFKNNTEGAQRCSQNT